MKLPQLLAYGLFLVSLLGQPAAAQLLDPSFSPPTSLYAPGTVYALGPQQADGKRLVSGGFTRINGTAVTSRLVRLDATGTLDQPFLQNVGSASYVYRIKGLPNGQYLLNSSGNSLSAGGLVRTELLRLNANGTGDASFDAGSGPTLGTDYSYSVDHAVQADGKIVVVGYFDSFNGTPAPGVVRLNANGSVDATFSVGTGTDITNYENPESVAIQPDGKILVGGYFNTFNGQTANGLVRLNANGSVDTSFSSPLQSGSEVVGLVLQPDGKILANGYLLPAGSSLPNSTLMRLLPGGTVDAGFTAPNFQLAGYNDPAVLLQPDGKILVMGYFSSVVGNHIARLNANGTQDYSFQTVAGPNETPYTIGLQTNGSVLLGGYFNGLNGTETPLGALTSTGAADPTFTPTLQIAGNIASLLLQPDGKVVITGSFTELNGQPVHRIARLSTIGAVDASFSAATGLLPSVGTSLALQPDGKLLVGTTAGLLRLNGSGSPDPGFVSGLGSVGISALALQADGKILAGGSFITYGVVPYNHLARLSSSGSLDPTFVRTVSSTVSPGQHLYTDAIAVQPDGKILVGGTFRLTGQTTSNARVVRYDATGALDATFTMPSLTAVAAGNAICRLFALALQTDGKILAGGYFTEVNGAPQKSVVRFLPNGTPDTGFAASPGLSGTVFALARQPNGRVLLGGSFTNSAATGSPDRLCRVFDNGQPDASFGATAIPNSTVRALLVQPDGAILLAGGFSTISGQPALGLARIVAANVLHVAAPAAVAERTAAWPVPAHGQFHIAPDQSAQPRRIELLDALGRPVRQQPATTAPEQTLSLDHLPAGMYLLRVSYAAGTVTRRIAVE